MTLYQQIRSYNQLLEIKMPKDAFDSTWRYTLKGENCAVFE